MPLPVALYPNREALATALFHGEGVELGVAKGAFSELILRTSRVRRLWGVDRWTDHHDSEARGQNQYQIFEDARSRKSIYP